MSRAATRERATASPAARADRARLRRRLVAALFGFAVGAFLALALSPRSHWLVRTQLSGWIPPDPNTRVTADMEAERPPDPISHADLARAAARLAEDAEVQAAFLNYDLQGREGVGTRNIPRVVALAKRFPKDPAIQAAALRLAWTGGHLAPAEIPSLLEIARTGQRLNPENAFFPGMRMGLLFEAKRSDAALAALSQAATLPRWNAYVTEQARGAWRLSDAASGKANTAGRAMMALNATFPYVVPLLNGSRAAARLAASREAEGDLAGGYAIRHALMRLGGTIRRQETSYIGTIAGMSMQTSAADHLGNASRRASGPSSPGIPEKEFTAYLQRAGHAGDIAAARREFAAHHAIDQVMRALADARVQDRLLPFSVWYRASVLLLKGAAWLGLAALLAALLARWRWANTVAGGYREAATFCLVATSLLLLAYGFVSLQTLRAATQTNRNLDAMAANEGRFYATLTGRPWPR